MTWHAGAACVAIALLLARVGDAQAIPRAGCDTVEITAAARRCWAAELRGIESELARYAAAARANALDGARFDSAHAAWARYRDAACHAAGSQFVGGTLEPVAELSCRVLVSRQRARQLWESYLRGVDTSLAEPRR